LSGINYHDATGYDTRETIMTDILSPEEQQSFHEASILVDELKRKVRILELTFYAMVLLSIAVLTLLVLDIWGWI
jgi:hypothetical protein